MKAFLKTASLIAATLLLSACFDGDSNSGGGNNNAGGEQNIAFGGLIAQVFDRDANAAPLAVNNLDVSPEEDPQEIDQLLAE